MDARRVLDTGPDSPGAAHPRVAAPQGDLVVCDPSGSGKIDDATMASGLLRRSRRSSRCSTERANDFRAVEETPPGPAAGDAVRGPPPVHCGSGSPWRVVPF